MKPIRKARITSLIKEEISLILQGELKDPRIGFVSVLGAEPTIDLKECKIFVSILGSENELHSEDSRLPAVESKRCFVLVSACERLPSSNSFSMRVTKKLSILRIRFARHGKKMRPRQKREIQEPIKIRQTDSILKFRSPQR